MTKRQAARAERDHAERVAEYRDKIVAAIDRGQVSWDEVAHRATASEAGWLAGFGPEIRTEGEACCLIMSADRS